LARTEASKDLSETDKKSVISYLEGGIRLLGKTEGLNAGRGKLILRSLLTTEWLDALYFHVGTKQRRMI